MPRTLPKSIYLETGTRNGMPENKLRETGITEVLPVFDKANLIPYCVGSHCQCALLTDSQTQDTNNRQNNG